jgi:hypothetical protein
MRLAKAALLTAAALTFVAAPAYADMVDSAAMTITMDGSTKTMTVKKLPKGAKLMKGDVTFVMMNGKMYMVTGRDAAIMQSRQ